MRTRWPLVVNVAAWLAMSSSILSASETRPAEATGTVPPIPLGSRVRLLAPTVLSGRIDGVLIQMDQDSLLLGGTGRSPVSVPRQAITRLQVSTGRRGHALQGMWIGAAIGAGTEIALGASGCFPVVGCGESYLSVGGVMASAAFGAAYGAGIGALVKSERWRTVSVEGVHMTVVPTRGRGVGLSVSVGF